MRHASRQVCQSRNLWHGVYYGQGTAASNGLFWSSASPGVVCRRLQKPAFSIRHLCLRPAPRRISIGGRRASLEPHRIEQQGIDERQETGISIEAQAVSPAWIRIERARHPQRPYPMDFIEKIFTDFSEIHAIAPLATTRRWPAAWPAGRRRGAGHRQPQGRLDQRAVRRNFGMPHPEAIARRSGP